MYKNASFGEHLTLLNDEENEYKVEVFYEK